MVELLGTYTSENASQAREDAQRCILAALADPNTFLLDPLLALKPVRFLEGQLIHDLLSIFVSEKLPSYLKFYQDHREFVQSQGIIIFTFNNYLDIYTSDVDYFSLDYNFRPSFDNSLFAYLR